MVEPVDVSALGALIRISFPEDAEPAFVENVRTAWSGALGDEREPDSTVELFPGDEEHVLEDLSMRVTLEALGQRRGELVMFHAAGVADEEGRVVAFVGPSGRGKTTLSRTLSRTYGYISDETIGVDRDLTVLPYRKPLSVVRPDLPKKQVSPQEAGMRDLPAAPLRLSALVLLERDADHERSLVEPVPFLDAVSDLVPQLSYLSDLDAPLQTLAGLCDAVGGIRRLRYPDAEEVATLVPELLATTPQEREWEAVPEAVTTGVFDTSPSRDAIAIEDKLVLLAGGQVQVLDGIAPEIWLSAHAGRDLDGIVADVVSVFGEPEGADPRALVTAATDELVTAGILARR